MMKKALALAGASALLATAVLPVFAGRHHHSSDDLDIWNKASVKNSVTTQASTGYNSVSGMLVCGKIRTGRATAMALVGNDVNYNKVDCDGCDGDVEIHNKARVRNNVLTQASSGYNSVSGFMVGGRIRTGAAYADSVVTNFVNTNIVR